MAVLPQFKCRWIVAIQAGQVIGTATVGSFGLYLDLSRSGLDPGAQVGALELVP
jgi:hypothetical protein